MLADYTHTTATTTEGGLDDDGEAIFVCEGLDVLKLLDRAGSSWHYRDVALDGKLSGRDLVAEGVNGVRGRTYELEHVSVWATMGACAKAEEGYGLRCRPSGDRPRHAATRLGPIGSDRHLERLGKKFRHKLNKAELLTMRPAFSTFRANSAFSDKNP